MPAPGLRRFSIALILSLGCGTQSPGSQGSGGATPGGGVGGDKGTPTGGVQGAGGATPTGGAASGGTAVGGSAAGGSQGTGGSLGAGGSKGTGGSVGAGGNKGTGGAAGAGGSKGSGGSVGAGGATGSCKRGIAANTAPGPAFFPAVRWWYNWSNQGTGAGAGIEFVPMIWGSSTVNSPIPAAAKFLLTFNEPNFHAQSNLTAAMAASLWPPLQTKAATAGIPLVSPGMNFCGPAASCNGTSPYQYLKDFFAACVNCQVDHVAVHWYNCDLPSLKDYLEPGGTLEGFQQFGKPIWLTEFSCDGNASVAQQEAFMRAALPYLDANPNVFRYSWFSANPIPNAKLINTDGSPTALGQIYIDLPGACR